MSETGLRETPDTSENDDGNLLRSLLEQTDQKRKALCRGPFGVTEIDIQVREGVVTVSLTGKILDEGSIQIIGEIFTKIIETPGVKGLILNGEKIGYNSTAGLGKYISADKNLKRKGMPGFGVAGLQPEVLEVFKITRLDKLFIMGADPVSLEKKIIEKIRRSAGGAMQQD